MKLIISENKEKLNAELAQWISELISGTLHQQEIFTIALAGGSTPGALYSELALNYTDKINWAKVHVFWGDERFVPPGDERNNAKMAYDKLLQFVKVPSAQVHRMRTDIQPLFAASEYQQILKHYFKNTISSFDLVLLGLGDDGHTLSLFPGSPLIEETISWVKTAYNENDHTNRITLTPAIVNRASKIVFLVTGKNKSESVHNIIEEPFTPLTSPAQCIQPHHGELFWFLDEDAASLLKH